MSEARLSLAILISGRGSNMLAIADSCDRGGIGARVACVASDRIDAAGLVAARGRGLEAFALAPAAFGSREAFEDALAERLDAARPDLVVLAGFMRILGPGFVAHYRGRMLNIHPSLLPSFAGRDGIGDALAHGVRVTGCTVHLVESEVDSGPIVAQAAVPVLDGDTRESLAARIHAAEHALYPEAVRRYVREPWRREGRRIVFGEGAGLAGLPAAEVAHG